MEVFILNMPQRQDRRESVLREFRGKDCFATHVITPVGHSVPRVSHWLTFRSLTKQAKNDRLNCFVFCEDDHVFTEHFDERQFLCTLNEANSLKADVLMGGVSSMSTPIQVSGNLFWLEVFNGTQFVIVFNRFYDKILSSDYLEENVVTDFHLSENSENIFVMFPFISVQKDFGYSDVTPFNNTEGYVKSLFRRTSEGLQILNKVRTFYHGLS